MPLFNLKALVLILGICWSGVHAGPLEIYKDLKGKYSNFKSFQAELKTSVNISDDIEVELSGKISVMMPDKWLITLSSRRGNKEKLCYYSVSNGKEVWSLDTRIGDVVKGESVKATNSTARFFPVFSSYDEKNMNMEKEGENDVFKLKIIEDGSIFSYVKMYVNAQKLEIDKMIFTGADGKQKMCISFENTKINEEIPEDTFVNKITGKIK